MKLKKLGRAYARKATRRVPMHIRDGWTGWRHRRTDERNLAIKRAKHRAYRRRQRLIARRAA